MKALFSALFVSLSVWFLVVSLGFVSACTPPKSANAARSEATAAVLATKTAWLAASNSCVALAKARHDDTLRQKCASVLVPAERDLLAAAAAVDAWPTLDAGAPPGDVACLVSSALEKLSDSPALQAAVGDAGASDLAMVGPLLDNARALASLLPGFGACHD